MAWVKLVRTRWAQDIQFIKAEQRRLGERGQIGTDQP